MSGQKRKSKKSGLDDDLPAWVDDQAPMRTTPYTEDELDLFVEDTLGRICDTAAWLNLVDRVGEAEARRQLRARIVMRDENTKKLTRH